MQHYLGIIPNRVTDCLYIVGFAGTDKNAVFGIKGGVGNMYNAKYPYVVGLCSHPSLHCT